MKSKKLLFEKKNLLQTVMPAEKIEKVTV